MSYIPSSGSVVAFQSNADNLKASVQGTVGASIIGLTPVAIQGSVITVGGSGGTQYLEGAVQSSVTGTAILFRSNENSSVLSAVHPNNPLPTDIFVGSSIVSLSNPLPIQPPASGVLPVIVPGSVATAQIGIQISSISGVPNVQGKDAPVASITGNPIYIAGKDINGSVAGIQVLGGAVLTVGSVSGSIGIIGNPSVSGTVATTQQGNWTTSLVSTVPSSVLVGASIFGQLPAGTAVLGSVATLQGTNPWIITGSVQTVATNTSVLVLNNPLVITGSVQGAGGGTQYAESDVVATATGTAIMFKKDISASTIAIVSPQNPLPTSVQGTVGASIIGTVPITVVDGTRISSLVSTVPSSVLVGASIFGTAPVTQSGTWIQSVIGAIAPTTAVTSIKTATSVTTLIASNTARRGVTISNNSATSILVKLGGMNTVNDYSLVMFINDYYEVPFNYSGAVSHYASSVAGLVYITEIT